MPCESFLYLDLGNMYRYYINFLEVELYRKKLFEAYPLIV